jgi:hypothetical protein
MYLRVSLSTSIFAPLIEPLVSTTQIKSIGVLEVRDRFLVFNVRSICSLTVVLGGRIAGYLSFKSKEMGFSRNSADDGLSDLETDMGASSKSL